MGSWMNQDGLLVRYGTDQGKRGSKGGVTTDTTKVNEFVLELSLAGPARTIYSTDRNNDGTVDGFSGLDTAIPAGAKVLSADVIPLVAPAGGTSYTVGTFALDGTAVDADGILDSTGAEGALVGTALSSAAYVTAVTTGTYTAGKVKVVIRYLIP